MCTLCDRDRLISAYGLTEAMVQAKAHYGAVNAGFLVPDGVGDGDKGVEPRPLLVATTDNIGGDTGTVATLTVGAAPIVSTIDTLGDQDFFKLELVAGRTYDISMLAKIGGPGLTPLADSFVELYDAQGALITSADGGANTALNQLNSGFDAVLTFTADRTGTYYVNARAFDNTPADGSTTGDLVGDYELSAQDVTDQPRYVPYYDVDSPLYALDWGSQVDGTVRNPDGREIGRVTGNAQEVADDKGTGIVGKNVIKIYFAKAGDVYTPEDPTSPGLPPAIVAVGAKDFEIRAVTVALGEFEKVADVKFVVTETREDADFHYVTYSGTPGPGVSLLGSMSPPNEPDEGLAQFNSGDERWNETNLAQGGFSFVTLIHEFGHGMGMSHPHDNGGRSGIMRGVEAEGAGVADYTTGDFDLNQGIHTMMSYEDGWQKSPYGNAPTNVGYGYLGGLMAFDIAVIQDKYGVNEDWARGNDVYTLKDVNAAGTFYSSIWDTGGADTIQYDGARDAVLDLRAATLKYEVGGGGFVSYADGIFGGYTIANGVVIEHANGGSGDDRITGNAANNTLNGNAGDDTIEGGLGNDRINGGDGVDTVTYASSEAAVYVNLAVVKIQDTLGAGVDRITGVENLVGSNYDDTLTGDDFANRVDGGKDDDIIRGAGGDDVLIGGAGLDELRGGLGADVFVFDDGDTGGTRRTADQILDFKTGQGDVIDLSLIDAKVGSADADDAFSFIGSRAFTGVAGQLRVQVVGGVSYVSGDTNGDKLADFMIHVVTDGPLQAGDFNF